MKYNGIFDKSETPEPGKYNTRTEFGNKRGFTIYSKLALPTFSNARNPGPANYNSTDSLNNSGRYVLSQLTNCPSYKIKASRPEHVSESAPGPGAYSSNIENLNASGSYMNSKHENSRCRTFSKSSKSIQLKLSSPGPGAYKYYS